jgi:hypothetical protein
MHEKSLITLEYPKIIERLVDEAAFSASKELARALTPSPEPAEARRRLDLTTEARRLLDLRTDMGVRGARDIRPHVAAARRGAVLTPANLLETLATARASAYVGRLMRGIDESFPLLGALARDLPERPQLEARIGESVSEEGADRRSSWRIAGMIVRRSALRCVVAASACASRRSDAQQSGEPSGDAQWWRARRSIGCGIRWNAASPSLGNFRRLLIRWERLFSVYRSGFAFAVMLLCVRRATALAFPIPLGYVARGRWTRHDRCNHAGARTAHGRTSVLGGKQLPVPLGDDFDGAVGHLHRGLIVDRVRWHG